MSEQRVFIFNRTAAVTRDMPDGSGQMVGRQLIEREQPLSPESPFIASGVNTLMPGAAVPVHTHENDEEVYFFISGNGLYIDNKGVKHPVGPGDAAFCLRGESHGLENPGPGTLTFGAAIAR